MAKTLQIETARYFCIFLAFQSLDLAFPRCTLAAWKIATTLTNRTGSTP
jgi:hypothetical protein